MKKCKRKITAEKIHKLRMRKTLKSWKRLSNHFRNCAIAGMKLRKELLGSKLGIPKTQALITIA